MVEESTRNAALESVRKAARQMLDFSDSDERLGSVKMAEVLEQALQHFGTPEDIFEAGEKLEHEDAKVLEEIEQQVRQVDQMVGSLCGNPGMIGPPRQLTGKRAYPSPSGMVELLEQRGFIADHRAAGVNVHYERYW